MERSIKYKRFDEYINDTEIQQFLDNLIIEGWEIIYYNEENISNDNGNKLLHIIIIGSKKQNNIL